MVNEEGSKRSTSEEERHTISLIHVQCTSELPNHTLYVTHSIVPMMIYTWNVHTILTVYLYYVCTFI